MIVSFSLKGFEMDRVELTPFQQSAADDLVELLDWIRRRGAGQPLTGVVYADAPAILGQNGGNVRDTLEYLLPLIPKGAVICLK